MFANRVKIRTDRKGFQPYHSGNPPTSTERVRKYRGQTREIDLRSKRVIAWDGEGMKLTGSRNPQHYVLFGCSADIDHPLVIAADKDDLSFVQLAHYACNIAERFPNSIHVGYFFEYDQNMIIKSLHWATKERLYDTGKAIVKDGETRFFVKLVLGKKISITRMRPDGKKSTIKIDDMGSFFAKSFVRAYSALFPEDRETGEFRRIVEGKKARGNTGWSDMPEVLAYWRDEIKAVQRLAEKFRDIMLDAGFMLNEWYGPGALANYVRRSHGLVTHEWGAKEENIGAAEHDAFKRGMFGGHVELFQVGRIRGPIYVLDINSAYPFAFTRIPTLREGGFWRWVDTLDLRRERQPFGIYHLRWRFSNSSPFEHRSQPLPHRDRDGNISFPAIVDGWYWTPEAYSILRRSQFAPFIECVGGFEWIPIDDSYPWADVILSMYEKRQTLKRIGSPTEMAFKLGPNSLYGKAAQRTGWNRETNKPPRSHSLAVAGYITSFCRAQILSVASHIQNPDDLIAIETDGLFTRQHPNKLPIRLGNALGQWSVTEYEEILFVQNGLYLAKKDGQWIPKTRGIAKFENQNETDSFANLLVRYFETLGPSGQWSPLQLPSSERFVGLGAALIRSKTNKGQFNPFKASALHCRWAEHDREMIPGGKGKRIHVARACPACQNGATANDAAHRLVIRSRALENPISEPYRLPWEGAERYQWESQDELARHELAEI